MASTMSFFIVMILLRTLLIFDFNNVKNHTYVYLNSRKVKGGADHRHFTVSDIVGLKAFSH